MGEVFWAIEKKAHAVSREVAVKRILPSYSNDPEFVAMFLDEAKISANLHHVNITPLYDFGEIEGMYYIAMEYIRGIDLRDLFLTVQEGRSASPELLVHIMAQVCRGLDYAHQCTDVQGRGMDLVHRDISHSNVRISMEGEVKLMDFGIAKAAYRSTHTKTDFVKGKTGYMSPEHLAGYPVDRRSDLFSLGVVFHELLTGNRLFQGDVFSVMRKIKEEEIPPLSTINPDVPGSIDAIVRKALEKNPENRYQQAQQMQRDLEKYLAENNLHIGSSQLRAFVRANFEEHLSKDRESRIAFQNVITRIETGDLEGFHVGEGTTPGVGSEGAGETATVQLGDKSRTATRETPAVSGQKAERRIFGSRTAFALLAGAVAVLLVVLAIRFQPWKKTYGPNEVVRSDTAVSIEPKKSGPEESKAEPTKANESAEPTRSPTEASDEKAVPAIPKKKIAAIPAARTPSATVEHLVQVPTVRFPISSYPWTIVYVDGKRLGATPIANAQITEGVHRFYFENKDLKFDHEEMIEVSESQTEKIVREFYGNVSLLSNMKARVFMDGKEIGQTPMMEYRVCAGNHEFVFQSIEDKPQERIVEENIKPFGSKRIEQTF